MKRAYVDIPEGQMHYRFCGQGETLIMLHMSGSSSDEYEQVGNLLADDYQVYALDMLTCGESDDPPRFYSFADHARTIVSFMTALGIESAYFYGSLVGANIAVHIASDYPQRVKGLMLGQLCHYQDPDHFKKLRHAPIFSQIEIKEDGSHMSECWLRSAKYGESATISNDRAICLHKARDNGEALHWALCEDENFTARLPKIQVPTVILNYGHTGNIDGQKLASQLIPGAQYEFLENATPYVARATPERVATLVTKYFGH